MRTVIVTLTGLAVLTALAGTASAATVVEMKATQEDGEFFFLVGDERNPTLNFAPGEEVIINLESDGYHNIEIGAPISKSTTTSNEAQSISFTIPEDFSGEIDYWCMPHKGLNMAGKIVVASAGDADGNESADGADGTDGDANADKPTPGAGAAVAALAIVGTALLAGRRRG